MEQIKEAGIKLMHQDESNDIYANTSKVDHRWDALTNKDKTLEQVLIR